MSDKVILRDKINLSENSQIIKSELQTAELLDNFFSNIIKNFETSKFSNYKPFIDSTEDRTLRAILKYKKPSQHFASQNQFKNADILFNRTWSNRHWKRN